jgi:hypothetical protein
MKYMFPTFVNLIKAALVKNKIIYSSHLPQLIRIIDIVRMSLI